MTAIALPHRGYHGPRGTQRFFEGWYYRLSLPEIGESFATIYSIEDPHGGSPFSQGAVQVLGRLGLLVETFPQVADFWGDQERLAFGHTRSSAAPIREALDPSDFWVRIHTGYQATDRLNQGRIITPEGKSVVWEYTIEPVIGWGRNQATMGHLSYLPVYEVGWQVSLAHGWAAGYLQWEEVTYSFTRAPVYIEKNWSLGFPEIWFWLQCNSFTIHQGAPDVNLTVTSGGGVRRTLIWEDEQAMVGLHYQGRFYDFRAETGTVRWSARVDRTGAGLWQVWGYADGYEIEIEARSVQIHSLLGPSENETLHPISLQSLTGDLTLRLYRGRYPGNRLILEARSGLAAVEAGGDGWTGSWEGTCG